MKAENIFGLYTKYRKYNLFEIQAETKKLKGCPQTFFRYCIPNRIHSDILRTVFGCGVACVVIDGGLCYTVWSKSGSGLLSSGGTKIVI
jgi:hypothetical protein